MARQPPSLSSTTPRQKPKLARKAEYEFWWAPVADVRAIEVLFGLGGVEPGDARWLEARSRARRSTEMLDAEFVQGTHTPDFRL
jgi:hypothetical protein